MRILVITTLLALGVACTDDGGNNNNDSSDTDDGCPDGLSKASSAAALINGYTQNGIGLALAYDADVTTSGGQPAACVSSDRRLAQWVLSSAGEPALIVRQSVTSFGSQAIDGSDGALTLEIIGIETTAADDWQSALWTVEAEGTSGPVTSVIDGTAITGAGGNYSLNAALEATP
ncbi:MAG: hypothetical protein EP330_19210 [Deltaproteobacteria bacterium]|nr:MAG: hypothetical protein EP330_19210 [Deltaproteobacteria bacterium]